MKLLAVIGSPVSHSLSPTIQNYFAERASLPYVYTAFDIQPETLADYLNAVKLLGIAGFNATMPHKEKLVPLLDEVDAQAMRIGAVNTVVNKDGKLAGYSTDGGGFVLSLKRLNIPIAGKAVVLGAGGAGKAVAAALADAGFETVVLSRKLSGGIAEVKYGLWSEIRAHMRGCAVLVNATPLGMHGSQTDFEDLNFIDDLPSTAAVYDLIYAPRQTNFLRRAAERGLKTVNGLPLLVCQAALAFQHFTGHLPSDEDIDGAMKRIEG